MSSDVLDKHAARWFTTTLYWSYLGHEGPACSKPYSFRHLPNDCGRAAYRAGKSQQRQVTSKQACGAATFVWYPWVPLKTFTTLVSLL